MPDEAQEICPWPICLYQGTLRSSQEGGRCQDDCQKGRPACKQVKPKPTPTTSRSPLKGTKSGGVRLSAAYYFYDVCDLICCALIDCNDASNLGVRHRWRDRNAGTNTVCETGAGAGNGRPPLDVDPKDRWEGPSSSSEAGCRIQDMCARAIYHHRACRSWACVAAGGAWHHP